MPLIQAEDVVIDFPIYGTKARSFKSLIANAATGGAIAKDAAKRVVVRALDHVSFEFHEGDRIGLVGHNGSGKSTLLRVLAGIYEPRSGDLSIQGRVTSMLSITLGMDMEATGVENARIRGHVMGIPPRQMDGLIDEIAEFSGIGDYLHLPMRTYSTGMTMRLAFAISTCINFDIILMDEWLSVGDADFAEKANLRLGEMLNQARIVVIASHDQILLKNLCNKIIHLERGKIVACE